MQAVLRREKLEALQQAMDKTLAEFDMKYCTVSYKKATMLRYKEGNPPALKNFPTTPDVQLCSTGLLQSPIVIGGEKLLLLETRANVFILENCFNKNIRLGVLVVVAECEAIIGCFGNAFDHRRDYQTLGESLQSVITKCFDESVLGSDQWRVSDACLVIYKGVRIPYARHTRYYSQQGCTVIGFLDSDAPDFAYQCQLLQSLQKEVHVLACYKSVNYTNVQSIQAACDSQDLNVLVDVGAPLEEFQLQKHSFALFNNKQNNFAGVFRSLEHAVREMHYKVTLNERTFALIAHLVLFGFRLPFERKPVYGQPFYFVLLWDGEHLPEGVEERQQSIIIVSPNTRIATLIVDKKLVCGVAVVPQELLDKLCGLLKRQLPVCLRCDFEGVATLESLADLTKNEQTDQNLQLGELDIEDPVGTLFEQLKSDRNQVTRDEAFIIASRVGISPSAMLNAVRTPQFAKKHFYKKEELNEILQLAAHN